MSEPLALRARHLVRLLPVAGLLLVAALAGLRPEQDALARNRVDPVRGKPHTYEITIPVLVSGADAKSEAREWRKAFDNSWGKGNPYKAGCLTIYLKADVHHVPKSGTDPTAYHVVEVNPVDPGDYHVSKVYPKGQSSPRDRSYRGTWSSNAPADVIAHEFGHLMGLGDEYHEVPAGSDGKRRTEPDPSKAPEYEWDRDRHDWDGDGKISDGEVALKPGETPSLMAEKGGQILDRHLRDIVDVNLSDDERKCLWTGALEMDWRGDGAAPGGTSHWNWSASMTLNLEEDDEGRLTGTADATLTSSIEGVAADCGAYTYTTEPIDVLFDVTGQREDDQMRFHFKTDQSLEMPVSWSACGMSGNWTDSWWTSFEDSEAIYGNYWPPALTWNEGAYVAEVSDVTSGAGFTVERWTRIRVEPSTDEGVPVG